MTSLVYAKPVKHIKADSVAKAIGYSLSHENFQQINGINIKIDSIKSELQNNIVDGGFWLKSVILYDFVRINKKLHIVGAILHTDIINRLIQTEFDANCTAENSKLIIIDTVKLKTYAKPRSIAYMVPSRTFNIRELKLLSFAQALEKVQSVAKHVENFDTAMDLKEEKYIFVSFMMNKINKADRVLPVMSDLPYSSKGIKGRLLKTSDNWLIAFYQTEFAYNNFQPQYFNILWDTDKKLIPVASYSTHGLVKEIQTALSLNGYDVGKHDGRLNEKTKTAIQKYINQHEFYPKTKISTTLLWFIQQNTDFSVPKIVQASLLGLGYKISAVDGKTKADTIKALKECQKALRVNPDGKITPEIVYLLLYKTKNIDTLRAMNLVFNKPFYLKTYQSKKWPNQI